MDIPEMDAEVEKYKRMIESLMKQEYPDNKERFKAMAVKRKKAELDGLVTQYNELSRSSNVFAEPYRPTFDGGNTSRRKDSMHNRERESTFRESLAINARESLAVVRQSIYDNVQTVRESVVAFATGAATAVQNALPKSATDIIKEAREGFIKVNKISGPQGEIPIPLSFSHNARYWEMVFWAALMGSVMGVIGQLYLVSSVKIPGYWYDCDFDNDVNCGLLYKGKLYFIPMMAAAGLCVGLYRWYVDYKMNTPVLFYELAHCRGELETGWHSFFLTGVSMAFGAALGPELGLVALGMGLSTVLADWLDFDEEDDVKLIALTGGVGALGAILPSPILGAMAVCELSTPPKEYMEHATILATSSFMSWFIGYLLSHDAFHGVDLLNTNGVLLSSAWTFKVHQCVYAVIIGLIGGAIGVLSVLIRIVCKQIFVRIRFSLAGSSKLMAQTVPNTLGGILLGITCYCLPLTIGFGNIMTTYVFKYGSTAAVPLHVLYGTLFVRLVSLGVSGTSGFRGGPFLCLIQCGFLAAVIAYRTVDLPLALTGACFMASVPASITAFPFLWTVLAAFSFSLNYLQTSCVFVAATTAYMFGAGTGLLHAASEFSIPYAPMPKPPMPKSPMQATATATADQPPASTSTSPTKTKAIDSLYREGSIDTGRASTILPMQSRSSEVSQSVNPMTTTALAQRESGRTQV